MNISTVNKSTQSINKRKRLGLDVGTGSIGWCLLEYDENQNYKLIDAGVRLYSPGDKKARSEAKTARIQRRRRKQRFNLLKKLLSDLPEMSHLERLQASNFLYKFRAKALLSRLEPQQLRAVLFQLSKRRGFKSNRKIGDLKNDETKLNKINKETQAKIKEKGARTYGEYLYLLISEIKNAKLRNSNNFYAHYIDRASIKEEFDLIRKQQQQYYPNLNWAGIESTLFFQRPLKLQLIGKCSLFPEEIRLPKSSYLALQFTMLQELNNLRIQPKEQRFADERPLTLEEIKKLLPLCIKQITVKHQAILKYLGLRNTHEIKKYSNEAKDHIQGCAGFDEHHAELLDTLNQEEEEERFKDIIAKYGFSQELEKAYRELPEGYIKYSKKAVTIILNRFWKGEGHIGKIINDLQPAPVYLKGFKTLEYYGKALFNVPGVHLISPCQCEDFECVHNSIPEEERRYGRSPNNVLHASLNQLRKLVNAIIDKYGNPDEIAIELVRSDWDLQGETRRRENKNNNDKARKVLQELGFSGVYAHEKQKLFDEMMTFIGAPCCVYCGSGIGAARLLHTDQIEIDHILPYATTKDNSFANKILTCRECNKRKAKRTPYEAFGTQPDYDQVYQRVPKYKRPRFKPDAMEYYHILTDGWSPRSLHDTSMIAKHARSYLQTIVDPYAAYAIRGSLTSNIRSHLRLGIKDRTKSHLHHAQDAFITALIGKGTVQRLQNFNIMEGKFDKPIIANEEALIQSFKTHCEKIIVSHKPNHALQGRLLKDTIYGVHHTNDGKIEYRNKQKNEDSSPQMILLYNRAQVSSEYAYVDVWECIREGKWQLEFTTLFDAFAIKHGTQAPRNQPKIVIEGNGPWKKVMRLRKGDAVLLNNNIYRVVKLLAADKRLMFCPISQNHEKYQAKMGWKTIPANALKKERLQLVHVNILGEVLCNGKKLPLK